MTACAVIRIGPAATRASAGGTNDDSACRIGQSIAAANTDPATSSETPSAGQGQDVRSSGGLRIAWSDDGTRRTRIEATLENGISRCCLVI